MKKLWTELYRPDTLDGYVFKDQAQKAQVQAWIDDGIIPHLLFSGAPGTGKCLVGSELIDIEVDTSTLSDSQIRELERFKITDQDQ